MRRTLTMVGKAMVATSVVLCLGSMVTSSFPLHQTFAVIMAMTMVFALAGDLFLIPVLLVVARTLPVPRSAPVAVSLTMHQG